MFGVHLSLSQHRWWVRRPDNIGAQRLAEGGVPATGAGSAQPVCGGFECRIVAKVATNPPSQTAISGYAALLRSLRSNVVGPHTRS